MSVLKKFASLIKLIISLGFIDLLRTVYFNLKYMPLNYAWHLPIILRGGVIINGLQRGSLIIDNPHIGCMILGHQKYSYAPKYPSYLHVEGTIRIKGTGFHNFHQGFIITVYPNAYLEIGNNFSAAANLKLTVTNKVLIGDNNMWSYQEIVMDSDIHQIFNMDGVQINQPGAITFGNNVWLGARCTVLKNISIADETIIGSSSVIYKSLDISNSVYAGSPAKLIKSGIKWKRDFLVPVCP